MFIELASCAGCVFGFFKLGSFFCFSFGFLIFLIGFDFFGFAVFGEMRLGFRVLGAGRARRASFGEFQRVSASFGKFR